VQRHHLETFLQHGKRKLGQWLDEVGATPIAIGPESAFKNLNRPEDF
jgi:molybdopterin-guanine dinucleotide biosynthesis protein A